MPLLSYAVSDFVAYTKIRSADVNSRFTDIKTLLNTTGLDDTNIQNAGITRATKLKLGTARAVVANDGTGAMSEILVGTSGQVLTSNGTLWSAQDSVTKSQFNYVLGSAAQMTAGTATNSTFASITLATGDRILVLPAYAASENWSINQNNVYIQGCGRSSVITGTVTFTSAGDFSRLTNCRVTDNITLNSGADGVMCDKLYLASGKTFNVDTAVVGELLQADSEG